MHAGVPPLPVVIRASGMTGGIQLDATLADPARYPGILEGILTT